MRAADAADSSGSTDTLNLGAMIQPITEENILDQPEFYNWGSSIVKGEDGRYHLFYAQMTKELGFYSWMTDGLISRAVADHPAGPYKYVETVLQGRGQPYWDAHTAHNPRITKFGGKYYLYYISTNPNGNVFDDEEMILARRLYSTEGMSDKERKAKRAEAEVFRKQFQENQRIGVAVADDVTGPWQRLDHPIVVPEGPIRMMTCNPAVVERPDGGYLMFVRGIQANVEKFTRSAAIALSDDPIGPWEIQDKAAVADLNSEDPAVWYDEKRQRYYAIYHAFGYMGLITSTDGLNWERAKHYKVLEKTLYKADGSKVEAARLERPFVYVEDGVPRVLTLAVRERSGHSYSVFVPLDREGNGDLSLEGYSLAWHDEFDGDELDLDNWFYRDGIDRARTFLSRDFVKLNEGALELHCGIKPVDLGPDNPHRRHNHGKTYEDDGVYELTAAGVITDWRFSDGYYETRSFIIDAEKWHPAYWLERAHADDNNSLLQFAYRSEIDIFETELQFSTKQSIRLHDWVTNGEHRKIPKGMTRSSDQRGRWVVWGMKLTRDDAEFFEDGKRVAYVEIPDDFVRDPRNMILSCVTLKNPKKGGIQRFDYVRYYAPDAVRESLQKEFELLMVETSLIDKKFVDGYDDRASGGAYQKATGAEPGDHVRYKIYVADPGTYQLNLKTFMPKVNQGAWTVAIDGRRQAEFKAGTEMLALGSHHFEKPGYYEVKFTCARSTPEGAALYLDRLDLIK